LFFLLSQWTISFQWPLFTIIRDSTIFFIFYSFFKFFFFSKPCVTSRALSARVGSIQQNQKEIHRVRPYLISGVVILFPLLLLLYTQTIVIWKLWLLRLVGAE
jgi:hypothetical protein